MAARYGVGVPERECMSMAPSGPNGSSHCRLREMTPTFYGFIRRICISGQCHVKESTRYGRLSPHSAPIEVGSHPRRHPQCPLESSNGARTAFSEASLCGEVDRTNLLLIILEGRATTRDLRASDPAWLQAAEDGAHAGSHKSGARQSPELPLHTRAQLMSLNN